MTKMTDLIHNVKPVKIAQGTVADTAIDTLGFYSAYFLGLADKATLTVTESDDSAMADATAVADTQVIKTANAINVVPSKRYIKVVVTEENVKVAGILFGADIDGNVNL